nr:peroxidase family protein [Planctomycetota bacterium]
MRFRIAAWIMVALLSTAAAGCGGSGGAGPMALHTVGGPSGVPTSIQTDVPITGAQLFEAGLTMHVIGVGDFPVTPTSSTTAILPLAPNQIPAGTYDVYLYTPRSFTPTLVNGLVVNEQPVLTSCTPNTFDANANTPFMVAGVNLIHPVTARFHDGNGVAVGPEIEMSMGVGGTSAFAVSPLIPSFSGSMAGTVQIVSGDGQTAVAGVPISLTCLVCEIRSIDGSGNNATNPFWGAAHIQLRRAVASAYADGLSQPSGAARPNPRAISNAVSAQTSAPANSVGASDMFWLWGQFLDHDIDLTEGATPPEPFHVQVPTGDLHFDPLNFGNVILPFMRSIYDVATGTNNPRQQTNAITAWIDGSAVYGSDAVRQNALRTNDGTGRMRTSAGDLPPFNTGGLPNADNGGDPTALFLCGDVRANEQVGLTSLHTVFLREHNRLADELRLMNPHLTGEEIYQAARRYVGALMQSITFNEFLPVLLGPTAIAPYGGYQPAVQPDIDNVFSTACYRFGHSLVSSTVHRLDAQLLPIAEGPLALRDAFFSPNRILDEGGIDPILRGFAVTGAQELDTMIVDDLRNFLFGPPGAGGLDLGAL